MRKSIAILLTLFVVLISQLTYAEGPRFVPSKEIKSTEEMEKEIKEIEAQRAKEIEKKMKAWEAKRQPRLLKFKKTIKDVGRFQAINIPSLPFIVILDTKEGHLWLWRVGLTLSALVYGGQLCPGEYIGEKVLYQIKED